MLGMCRSWYLCIESILMKYHDEILEPPFYCTTIAYHVGLNAVLGWPQGIRPTSKKNRHL